MHRLPILVLCLSICGVLACAETDGSAEQTSSETGFGVTSGEEGEATETGAGETGAGETGAPFLLCEDVECEDGDPCTEDVCDDTGECVYSPLDGAPCDDGDACTVDDTCSDKGECAGDANAPCEDDNGCTTDTCDPGTGCIHALLPDGESCNDGDSCTLVDSCVEGECVGSSKNCPDDGNPCTVPAGCDITDGTCLTSQLPDGALCDDGNECTSGDACTEGQCLAPEETGCFDNNECTEDTCNPKSGCEFLAGPKNGTSCSDDNLCSSNDACAMGICSGTAISCDDGNPCTDDSCTQAGGCEHAFINLPCEDGNLCTINDACAEGLCTSGIPKPCDDGNTCTTEYCALESGNCNYDYNTSDCDDGDACSSSDTCVNGSCLGGADDCDDGDACTSDSCLPGVGCQHIGDSSACDDGFDCTEDSCAEGGECAHAPNDAVCGDAGECTTPLCDPDAGCQSVPDDTQCNDGLSCSIDTCEADGSCSHALDSALCDDDNPCTDNVCFATSGCAFAYNDAPCDDGNSCTLDESCSNGECEAGSPLPCDDGIACTIDACVADQGCVHTPDDGACAGNEPCTSSVCSESLGCVTDNLINCCGNGITEEGEECDDGNDVEANGATDICSTSCEEFFEAPGCATGEETIVSVGTNANQVMGLLSLTLSNPSGVLPGDVLIAHVTTNNFVPAGPPAGWSVVEDQKPGGNCGSESFVHVVSPDETSSWSFSFASSTYASGVISAYRNVDNSTPIHASTGNTTGVYSPTPLTTTVPGAMLVFIPASGNGGNSWSTPSGWTLGFFGQQNSTSCGLFYKLQGAPGQTAPITAPSSISDEGHTHLIALTPTCATDTPDDLGGEPVPGDRRVFVTSTHYKGDLGGLSGADAQCQVRANAANLGGTWKAWLSDSLTDAKDRLVHPMGALVRIDGTVIASNWDALVNGWPAAAPEITEYGLLKSYVNAGSVPGCSWAGGYFFHPWTATDNQGGLSGMTCDNWTSSSASATGWVGLGGYSLSQWTDWCNFPCNMSQPLYCFEQNTGPDGGTSGVGTLIDTLDYNGMTHYPIHIDQCTPNGGNCCGGGVTTQSQMNAFCELAGYSQATDWVVEQLMSTNCYCWNCTTQNTWKSNCCSGASLRNLVTQVTCI